MLQYFCFDSQKLVHCLVRQFILWVVVQYQCDGMS